MRNPFSNIFNKYSKKVGLPPGILIYAGEERDESTKIELIDYNDTHCQESIVESINDYVSYRTYAPNGRRGMPKRHSYR